MRSRYLGGASPTDRGRWLLAAALATGVGVAARRRDALSLSGAIGATAVGTAIFGAGGARSSALLLLFFGSSTALSRTANKDDEAARTGPRRTLVQVLANGGVPALLALAGLRYASPRVAAAYAGALAAANADTWATEIGRRSSTPPRMITSGRPAQPGVSGAVTPLGTLASWAGAILIGAGHATLTGSRPAAALPIAVAGAAGALADSILGAKLQAVYVCRTCARRTEDHNHRHDAARPALTLTHGLPIMTNDTVNLCASLTGAIIGAMLEPATEAAWQGTGD